MIFIASIIASGPSFSGACRTKYTSITRKAKSKFWKIQKREQFESNIFFVISNKFMRDILYLSLYTCINTYCHLNHPHPRLRSLLLAAFTWSAIPWPFASTKYGSITRKTKSKFWKIKKGNNFESNNFFVIPYKILRDILKLSNFTWFSSRLYRMLLRD